jgi:hypothetical protein
MVAIASLLRQGCGMTLLRGSRIRTGPSGRATMTSTAGRAAAATSVVLLTLAAGQFVMALDEHRDRDGRQGS